MFDEGTKGGTSVCSASLTPLCSFQHLVIAPHLPQSVRPDLLPKVFLFSVLSVSVGIPQHSPARLLSRVLDPLDKINFQRCVPQDGTEDTQYSQPDSPRRINGNARLLQGGNASNSLFLRLLCGEADNGPGAPGWARARPQAPSLRQRGLRKGQHRLRGDSGEG